MKQRGRNPRKRRFAWTVLCLTVTIAIASTALAAFHGVVSWPSDSAYTSRPSQAKIEAATAQCTPTTGTIASPIIGISDPNTELSGVITLINNTGVKWVRAEWSWNEIQASSGSGYDWSAHDTMTNAFVADGINIVGIITYIPQWVPAVWPTADTLFQAYVTALVQRYKDRVHYWEIFNEPNYPGHGWLQSGVTPSDFYGSYTWLLAHANTVIHSIDPTAVILIGGISGNSGVGTAEDMMTAIYGYANAKNCFDIFAFHPYGYQGQFPTARTRVNAILAAGGDTKPVWFNEYGWSDYASMDENTNPTPATNPMMKVFTQLGSSDGGVFWFCAKDYSTSGPTFGLADYSLELRTSYTTFVDQVHIYAP